MKGKFDADKIFRDIITLAESFEEDYYRLTRNSIAFSSNYIEYESNEDKDKMLSTEKYLDKIEPYLNNLIDDHKNQGEWKIQLTMAINFISSKYSNETPTMSGQSDNIEIMIDNATDEIIEELFNSLRQRYQNNLEESMKGKEFLFDEVGLFYYKLHKISLSRSGSNIDSSKWSKNRKTAINPGDNDNKCFQYAINIALKYQNI